MLRIIGSPNLWYFSQMTQFGSPGAPTPSVGTKFESDGGARFFPGNSIVSNLAQQSTQHELLCRMQDDAKRESFGESLTFLPPSSFHMTLFDLVCDQIRQPEHWSSKIGLDAPLSEVDAQLARWLEPLSFPQRLSMKVDCVGRLEIGLHVLLEPIDNEVERELRNFREGISRTTGIRHPDHETYPFHITLAYMLRYLTVTQQRDLQRFVSRWDATLAESFGVLDLEPAQLVFFDDMLAFPSERGGGRLA